MNKEVKLFATTLRDGEQSPGAAMSAAQKPGMAITLERLGIECILPCCSIYLYCRDININRV